MAPSNAVARAERAALADLMLEVGPDAPTLCGTWTTRDLAARLGVEMPITETVYAVINGGVEPRAAVTTLMMRETKAEI